MTPGSGLPCNIVTVARVHVQSHRIGSQRDSSILYRRQFGLIKSPSSTSGSSLYHNPPEEAYRQLVKALTMHTSSVVNERDVEEFRLWSSLQKLNLGKNMG